MSADETHLVFGCHRSRTVGGDIDSIVFHTHLMRMRRTRTKHGMRKNYAARTKFYESNGEKAAYRHRIRNTMAGFKNEKKNGKRKLPNK